MCGSPLETTAGRHQDTDFPSRTGPTSRDSRTVSRCGPWPPSDWFPGLTWEGWFGFSSVGNGSAGLVSWPQGFLHCPQGLFGSFWSVWVCTRILNTPRAPSGTAPCWTCSVWLSRCIFDASGADIPAHTRLSGFEN